MEIGKFVYAFSKGDYFVGCLIKIVKVINKAGEYTEYVVRPTIKNGEDRFDQTVEFITRDEEELKAHMVNYLVERIERLLEKEKPLMDSFKAKRM